MTTEARGRDRRVHDLEQRLEEEEGQRKAEKAKFEEVKAKLTEESSQDKAKLEMQLSVEREETRQMLQSQDTGMKES